MNVVGKTRLRHKGKTTPEHFPNQTSNMVLSKQSTFESSPSSPLPPQNYLSFFQIRTLCSGYMLNIGRIIANLLRVWKVRIPINHGREFCCDFLAHRCVIILNSSWNNYMSRSNDKLWGDTLLAEKAVKRFFFYVSTTPSVVSPGVFVLFFKALLVAIFYNSDLTGTFQHWHIFIQF